MVDPPFSRAVISLACWQAAQGEVKQRDEIKQSEGGEKKFLVRVCTTMEKCDQTVTLPFSAKAQLKRTHAVLVLETILGSNTGTNDPVGVALNEAIADGA